jgi:hypothetical protein
VSLKSAYSAETSFRDVGQLDCLTVVNGANVSVISPGYGGLSNVWGSQIRYRRLPRRQDGLPWAVS